LTYNYPGIPVRVTQLAQRHIIHVEPRPKLATDADKEEQPGYDGLHTVEVHI
jgi:hypothetical protein